MPPDAVLFDAHGTLVDSGELFFHLNKRLLGQYGLNLTPSDFHRIWIDGNGLEQAVQEYSALAGKSVVTLRNHRWHLLRKENQVPQAHIKFRPGAASLINDLKKSDTLGGPLMLGVVSNNAQRETHYLLRQCGIADTFAYILCREQAHQPKPSSAGYLQIAEILEVDPTRCVVFEDSQHGVRAAKDAGMRCYAVPHHLRNKEDFGRADRVLSSLEDISRAEIYGLFSH